MLASAVLWDLTVEATKRSVAARASEGEESFCTARALGYRSRWRECELDVTSRCEGFSGACAAPRPHSFAQELRVVGASEARCCARAAKPRRRATETSGVGVAGL